MSKGAGCLWYWGFRLMMLVILVLAICGLLLGLYINIAVIPPLDEKLEDLRTYRPPTTVQVLDKNNAQIDRFYLERRFWVDYDELPPAVGQAFVAAEDRRFRDHPGIDIQGIARAMRVNFAAGEVVEGGSTLTQQLIKNLLVGSEKSYTRKLNEALAALRLEETMSKDEILEMYLNFVYLGSGNYGVEAASRDYFGVSARELDAGQAAMLAGLVPAPSAYNPRRNLERATMRRALVLRTMLDEKFIVREEYDYYLGLDEQESILPRVRIQGPMDPSVALGTAYLTTIRREVRALFGETAAYQAGYQVKTPYDGKIQRIAEDAIKEATWAVTRRQAGKNGRPKLDEINRPFIEGSAVVMENATGNVIALVGGYDVPLEGFVRATQGRRQPGSAFKPIVYAEALTKGRSQLDKVYDGPMWLPAGPRGQMWSPKNYNKRYRGYMTINSALAYSVNTIAVKLAMEAGIEDVMKLAKEMGVETPLAPNLSLALGSSEVTVVDMATAYTTLARYGEKADPVFIRELKDISGAVHVPGSEVVLPDGTAVTLPGGKGKQVLRPGVAYELIDMMRGVVERGTGTGAWQAHQDRAAKTGTTSSYHDAWFVGFTPRHTVAVWIGTDDYTTLGRNETGGKVALPAWKKIMDALGTPEDRSEAERFIAPADALLVPWAGKWVGIARGHHSQLPGRRPRPTDSRPLPDFPGANKVIAPGEDTSERPRFDPPAPAFPVAEEEPLAAPALAPGEDPEAGGDVVDEPVDDPHTVTVEPIIKPVPAKTATKPPAPKPADPVTPTPQKKRKKRKRRDR